VTGVGVAQLTLNWLIPVYLGEEFVSSVPIIRLLALSAIPYIMFSALRSVVDAAFRKAINARNICLSVIFFGAATALFHYSGLGVDGVLWANLAGHVLLAALTIVEVVRIFRVDEPGDDGNWTLGR
jgi:O-antigen/teichoic acid export membrane protein